MCYDIYNKNKFNNAVGATNNLRGLSAKVEFIEDILPQNSKKSSGECTGGRFLVQTKAGIDEIPNLHGIIVAINKKQVVLNISLI